MLEAASYNADMNYSPEETRRFIAALGLSPNSRAAFARVDSRIRASFAWHTHEEHHQLVYALEGALILRGTGRRHLLPPLRAGFITAGTRHRTEYGINGVATRAVSVFFAPALLPAPAGIHTLNASPLLREMVAWVSRWGPDHQPDPVSLSCFRTLGLLCLEWMADPLPFWLPSTQHPHVRRALRYVDDHLEGANEEGAAAAAAMSLRTFRRHFAEATGLTWREYLQRARMLRAADLLVSPDRSIADVAWEVGYRSVSAFSQAFTGFAGESPGVFRRR